MAASKTKTGTRIGAKDAKKSAKKKSAKKTAAKRGTKGRAGSAAKRSPSARGNPIDDALARLERDIPRLLRQLRRNVQDLQRQVARARSDGEKRWQTAERKLKQDANRLRSRLEGAIGRVRGGRRAKPGRPARGGPRRPAGPKPRKSSRKRST